MNRFIIILVTTLLLGISCSKEPQSTEGCLAERLEAHEMDAYNGESIGCKFYLELFEFQNEQYFLFGSHCADVIADPIDCEGNSICDGGSSIKCNNFWNNSVSKGIVGVSN